MSSVVSVLLVEPDERQVRKRAEQLLMDGYAVDGVSAVDAARVKLAQGPDVLVLGSGLETIGLLRELRAGEIPRADVRLSVNVVGADDDSAGVRYYRAGADAALPSQSSPLLVAAGVAALARRIGGPERRQVLRVGPPSCPRRRRAGRGRCRKGESVSQNRDGSRQIQSLAADTARMDAMIAATSEKSCDPLADRSLAGTGYRSVYTSSCTVVYTQVEEVS